MKVGISLLRIQSVQALSLPLSMRSFESKLLGSCPSTPFCSKADVDALSFPFPLQSPSSLLP